MNNKKRTEILLLEDRSITLTQTKNFLEKEGYFVWNCSTIFEARLNWEDFHEKISIIVTDLNMEPRRLNEKERVDSQAGLFSGLVWLTKYIANDKSVSKDFLSQIIIFSEYINKLEDKLATFDKDYKEIYKKIKEAGNLVYKSGQELAYNVLIKKVKSILTKI
jgi:CheY-like chemotaxis protein